MMQRHKHKHCRHRPVFGKIDCGCGGSLVDSLPFVRRVVGSNPALATTGRDLGQVLHSQLPVALRRETRHDTRIASGALLSSSGLEEAL